MPTIVINDRMDRNDKTVTVTLAEARSGERKLTYERGKQYVVPHEILEVLEHSHEAPHVRVLDPHSKEPTVESLPKPEPSPDTQSQIGELVETFGKAKAAKDKAITA
jgi:hypothetical protein